MQKIEQQILYEDNHLLVVNKPTGLATMGLPQGEETLLTLCKDYIARKYRKTGNVYLGVVSRLDFFVSGVIVLARTSKAAARLNEQFRTHTVTKSYLAIVEGKITPTSARLIDWMCEDPRHRKMWITQSPKEHPDAKEAILRYQLLRPLGRHSLVQVELETGRKHQIRLQLSNRHHPILGDFKYGSRETFPNGIALHAEKLTIEHPTTGEKMTFVAPVPNHWPK